MTTLGQVKQFVENLPRDPANLLFVRHLDGNESSNGLFDMVSLLGMHIRLEHGIEFGSPEVRNLPDDTLLGDESERLFKELSKWWREGRFE